MVYYFFGTNGRKAIRIKHKFRILAKGTFKIAACRKNYRNNFARIFNQRSLLKTLEFHNIMRLQSLSRATQEMVRLAFGSLVTLRGLRNTHHDYETLFAMAAKKY